MSTFVQMKDKGQVTIPVALREALDTQAGDLLEIELRDGAYVLRPALPARHRKPSGDDLSAFIGSGRGVFNTPSQVDAYIAQERAKWR